MTYKITPLIFIGLIVFVETKGKETYTYQIANYSKKYVTVSFDLYGDNIRFPVPNPAPNNPENTYLKPGEISSIHEREKCFEDVTIFFIDKSDIHKPQAEIIPLFPVFIPLKEHNKGWVCCHIGIKILPTNNLAGENKPTVVWQKAKSAKQITQWLKTKER